MRAYIYKKKITKKWELEEQTEKKIREIITCLANSSGWKSRKLFAKGSRKFKSVAAFHSTSSAAFIGFSGLLNFLIILFRLKTG